MAHNTKFNAPLSHAEMQAVIAKAHQMRSEVYVNILRKALSFVTSLFHRSGRPADTSA